MKLTPSQKAIIETMREEPNRVWNSKLEIAKKVSGSTIPATLSGYAGHVTKLAAKGLVEIKEFGNRQEVRLTETGKEFSCQG